jgi:hypothetical protein
MSGNAHGPYRHLDLRVEQAPAECREPMLANVGLDCEIAADCREPAL